MKSVLLVEDNPTLLESVAFELEMRKFEVMTAEDGVAALTVLKTTKKLPDIIVSDIAMPDMDGYQLLEHVRANDHWSAIPFIFLTAFNSPNAVKIGKDLGADDYLTKPFQPDDLVSAINNKLVRVQQMQRHAQRQVDTARRELINLISHELHTPMTSIYGGAEMLKDALENTSDEMAQTLLKLVQGGAQRMNRLVERIVLLTQIDSGHLEATFKQVARVINFIEVLESGIEQAANAPDLADHQVQVKLNAPRETLAIQGVAPFVQAVIEEGIRNAIKFSRPQQIVQVQVTANAEMIGVAISDQGIGIPADKLASVWERFRQVDRESQEQQGVGLGLPMIADIMRIHGGEALINSQPNKGTTLTLNFPRVMDADM